MELVCVLYSLLPPVSTTLLLLDDFATRFVHLLVNCFNSDNGIASFSEELFCGKCNLRFCSIMTLVIVSVSCV